MSNTTRPDHYDALEVSQNASPEAIEKMFRYLATKHHPDAGGNRAKFNQVVQAFEVLRDPDTKDAYDRELVDEAQEISRLIENSKETGSDAMLRHEVLCLFYARRRERIDSPALGEFAIEKTLGMAKEVIEFQLWYFKEKGWITRCENGGYAITAEGVDQIDATEMKRVELANHLRITSQHQAIALSQGAMVTS